eukprot:333052_1
MSGAKIRNTATQFNRISSIQTGCTQYKGINNIKKERGYYKNQIKTYIQSNPHLMVDEIWKWFNKAEYKKWNKAKGTGHNFVESKHVLIENLNILYDEAILTE